MLSGSMPGMLKRWVRSSRGEWYGLVWVPLGNEDGTIRLTLDDPFMPAAALQCANDQHHRMIQASHRQSEHSAMWQLVAAPPRAPTGYPVGFQKSACAADLGARCARSAGHDRGPCRCGCCT